MNTDVEHGADVPRGRHLKELLATCHAIGRAEYLLNREHPIPDSDRLVMLAEVITDLSRDLGLTETDTQAAASMEGDR